MLPILITLIFGFTTGNMTAKQTTYCDCYRSGFSGEVCAKIKGSGAQGSCHD